MRSAGHFSKMSIFFINGKTREKTEKLMVKSIQVYNFTQELKYNTLIWA